jgi:hypothetical protein
MRVGGIDSLTFQYNHPLKKAFDKGLLGKDFKGLYGVTLTKKNRTLEHIKPHSLGGGLNWGNVALADKIMNSKRGIKPIEEFVTFEMWKAYLQQFIGIKNDLVDGIKYIKQICKEQKLNIKEILNV